MLSMEWTDISANSGPKQEEKKASSHVPDHSLPPSSHAPARVSRSMPDDVKPLEDPLAKARVSRKQANQNFERKADCMGVAR